MDMNSGGHCSAWCRWVSMSRAGPVQRSTRPQCLDCGVHTVGPPLSWSDPLPGADLSQGSHELSSLSSQPSAQQTTLMHFPSPFLRAPSRSAPTLAAFSLSFLLPATNGWTDRPSGRGGGGGGCAHPMHSPGEEPWSHSAASVFLASSNHFFTLCF